jgi:glycosyltransferase involved in cell wall biosynthesis
MEPRNAMQMRDDDKLLELSILMPCLNEVETLEFCIKEAQTFLSLSGVRGEVVVADNGSTDGSIELAEELGARVVRVPVRGYGAALFFGSMACFGAYIIMADSDASYDLANLGDFVKELRSGKDLVMGNRFRGGIMPGAMPWKNRYIGNPILSFVGRLLFGSQVGDFHCGLRGYRKDVFMKLDLRTTGMEFASEMVIKAQLLGLKVSEVPTVLRPDGRSRPPHLRPWRDGWRHLRFMLMYSPSWLFVYPGMLVAVLASVVTACLLCFAEGSVVHDFRLPGLLLSCLLILAAAQSSIFGGFLLVFSTVEGFRPQKASFYRIFKFINLEVGVTLGFLVFMGGCVGTLVQLRTPGSELTTGAGLANMIPTAMMALLGLQVVLSSFFFSVLGIGLRRAPHPFEELDNWQENSGQRAIEQRVMLDHGAHGDDGNLQRT